MNELRIMVKQEVTRNQQFSCFAKGGWVTQTSNWHLWYEAYIIQTRKKKIFSVTH